MKKITIMSFLHYPYSNLNLCPGDKLVVEDTYSGIFSIKDHNKTSCTKYGFKYDCEVIEDKTGYIVRFVDLKTKKHVCDHHLYNVEIDCYKGDYKIISLLKKQQTELVF